MEKTTLHVSYDFVFSKLHAQWSQAVAGERLEALLPGGDPQGLARFLESRGAGDGVKPEVQRNLTTEMVAALGRIMGLLEPAGAAFYRAFISRCYYDNLKAILHYRRQPDPEVSLAFLVIASPHLPHLQVEALVEAKTVNQFFRALPVTPSRLEILPTLVELEESGDVFLADTRLDHLFYRDLLAHAAALPAATELVRREVDLFNVVMLLRNAEIYHLPEARIRELLVDGGLLLSAPWLGRLAALSDPGRITGALPAVYAGVLQPILSLALYRRENVLWEILYRNARQAFRDFTQPVATVAAFPFLKRTELQNLCRLYEGFRVGLEPAEIRAMMIGLAHV